MEKMKTVLDREPLSSDYINSKQDFDKVVSGYKALNTPIWKSVWFYGTAGLATIAIVATTVLYSPTNEKNDQREARAEIPTMTSPDNSPEKAPKNFIALHNPASQKRAEKQVQDAQPVKTTLNTKLDNIEVGDHAMNDQRDDEMHEDLLVDESDQSLQSAAIQKSGNTSRNNMMPSLAGVYFGDIHYSKICDQRGIQSAPDLAIISFNVQFYNGRESIERSVRGNVIPSDLCEQIIKTSMGNTVFITDIKAEHRVTGRTTTLTSMNLVPTK